MRSGGFCPAKNSTGALLLLAFFSVAFPTVSPCGPPSKSQKKKPTQKQIDKAEVELCYARRAERGRDFEEARRRYESAVSACPLYAKAHLKLALFRLGRGSPGDAVQPLEKVLDLDPKNLQAINLLGCLRFREGRLESALEIFQKGVRSHPGDADIRNNLSCVLFSMKDFEGALKEVRRVDNASPSYYVSTGSPALHHIARLKHHQAVEKIKKATGVTTDIKGGSLRLAGLPLPPRPEPVQKSVPSLPKRREAPKQATPDTTDLAEAEISKARSLHRAKDIAGALQRLDRAKKASPSYVKSYYCAAEIHFQLKDFGAAIEEMDALLSRKPSDRNALNLRGLALFSVGETTRSEESFRKALEIYPSFPEARYNLAVVLASTGRADEAFRQMKTLSYQSPLFFSSVERKVLANLCLLSEKDALSILEETRAGGAKFHERILILEGLDAKRISALRKTASRRKDDRKKAPPEEKKRLSARDKALEKGLEAVTNNKLEMAKTCFEKALKEDPRNALAALALRFVREEEDINRLRQMEFGTGAVAPGGPRDFFAFLEIASLEKEEKERAVEALQTVKTLNPKDSAACFALASLHVSRGNNEKAERELRGILAFQPDSLPALVNLSRLYVSSGSFAKAEGCLRKIAKIVPDNPAVQSDLGVVLSRRKKYREAEAQYHRAIEIDPKFADAHYNLACCLALQGKKEEALAALKEAVRLGFGPTIRIRKDPDLAPLKSDPRFESLLVRIAQ